MEKIFVTGAAGFIGSHVVEALIDEREVHVIDNLSTGKESNIHPEATFHNVDICDTKLQDLIREHLPEVIVHCAAQISVSSSVDEPVYDEKVNIGGLLNILDTFQGEYKPHIVFTSTGGAIYGEQETYPASEDHVCQPEAPYGLSKLCGERYIELLSKLRGYSYTILRLSNVYGPRQSSAGESGVIGQFITRILAEEPLKIFGTGDQTRDYVYVGDVVRAVELAIEKRPQGIFNIGTGKETSVNDLVQHLREGVDSDLQAEYLPAKSGEVFRSCIDPSKAYEVFGWKANMEINNAISTTYTWYKDNA